MVAFHRRAAQTDGQLQIQIKLLCRMICKQLSIEPGLKNEPESIHRRRKCVLNDNNKNYEVSAVRCPQRVNAEINESSYRLRM